MRVLGVDPGLASCGYGVVEILAKPIPRPGDLFGGDVYEAILEAGVIETEPTKSSKVRVCDDEMRRMGEQAEHLLDIARENKVRAICAETRSAIHIPDLEITPLQTAPVEPARLRAVASELLGRLRSSSSPTEDEIVSRLLELVPRGPTSEQLHQVAKKHGNATYGVVKGTVFLALSWGIVATVATVLDVPVLQTSPQALKKRVCGRNGASKSDVFNAIEKRYGEEMLRPVKALPLSRRFHASDALACIVALLDHDVLRMARRAVADSARIAQEGDIEF